MKLGTRKAPTLTEGVVLGMIATGAISIAIAALTSIIQTAFAVFGDEVSVRMPVTGGPVSDLEGVPGITAASYASADVSFSAVPLATRWLLLLEGALPATATIGVCLVAWWLGVSLIRSHPFRRSMSRAIGVVACVVVAGGLFGQLAGAMGRAVLVEHLASTAPDITETFWTLLVQLDLAPVGWGFALALIAGAFEMGERMQRETEGLV